MESSNDLQFAAVATADGHVCVMDLVSVSVVRVFHGYFSAALALAWSPDDTLIAVCSAHRQFLMIV